MRTKDDLFDLEDILTLYQYLYMSEDHFVIVNNKLTDLKLYMTDDFDVMCINMLYPDLPPMSYNDMLFIPNMLGVIDYLKQDTEHVEMKGVFKTRWEEIFRTTRANIALNKEHRRRYNES